MAVSRLSLILTLAIFLALIVVLYSYRFIFFYKYEPEYYENLFYHSQWSYPASARGISDGELYKFVGYSLVEGENPFYLNYEVPPFAKYLYGLSEKTIGNPFLVSVGLYLASIGLLYFLAKDLFPEKQLRLLILFLFVTTPFVVTQIKETMLDLPLMTFFLAHFVLFIKFMLNKKYKYLIASGIFLGIATGTKLGVYTPLIALLDTGFLIFPWKKVIPTIRNIVLLGGSTFAGYVIAYTCYFVRHPNPIPWLKLHDKQWDFYTAPGGEAPDRLNQWRTIFMNNYQELWNFDLKHTLSDWSLILPIGVIATLIVFIWAIRNKNRLWMYISALSIIFLSVNTYIPFWPRYLMPVIPLFIVLIGFTLKKFKYVLLVLALLNIPFLMSSLTPPDVAGDAEASARFISTRAYREIYRSIDASQRKNIPEKEFITTYENFLEKIGARTVEVKINEVVKNGNSAQGKFTITYKTHYGDLTHSPTIEFVNVNNQWKTNWKWDYIWPGFTADSQVIDEVKTIPLARIENNSGVAILKRDQGKAVYVIPRLMRDWNQNLVNLENLTYIKTEDIDHQLKNVIPDEYPRFVGYLDPTLHKENVEKGEADPAVRLQDISYFSVGETGNMTDLDVSKRLRQVRAEHPELFFIEANIYILKPNGEKIILPTYQPKEKDVSVQV